MAEEQKKRRHLKSFVELQKVIKRNFLNLKLAPYLGRKVAYVTSGAPVEILRPFGFETFYPENHGAICGARNSAKEMIERVEQLGYSRDLCSYARTDISLALYGGSPAGKIPKPDLLFISNNICGTVLKWFEDLSYRFKVPLIIIDTPFLYNDIDEKIISYVKLQIENAVQRIEEITGKRISLRKFNEAAKESAVAVSLWKEVLAQMKNRPSPLTSFEAFMLMSPIVTMRGKRGCTLFYERLLVEVKNLAARGIGAVENEKVRLVWDNIPVWFAMRELRNYLKEKGASLVADTYTHAWANALIDLERPFYSLARTYTDIILNMNIERRIKEILRLMEEFDADGAVLHSNRSCKPYSFGQYLIRDAINNGGKKVALIFDADMSDPRCYSSEQTRTRLEAFIENLSK